MSRSVKEIAREISQYWKHPYFGAEPYLKAMFALDSVYDNYFEDSGKMIVLYFLANAKSWRGDVARRIKKELKDICGVK